MENTILTELKNNTTSPCVSLIIPTHRTSPGRVSDKLEISKIIAKAKELVLNVCRQKDEGTEIIDKLNKLSEDVDYLHNNEGIGLFVSPGVSRIVKFPFPVTEKVTVGNTFEIRDLLYLEETMINYNALMINEKEIRLFEGTGETLRLVHDENFPMLFLDDYEYSRTSLGSSYGYALKSTEKDRSIVKEQRLTTFLKQADQKLSKYLATNAPLIISGNSKDLGYFKKVSTHYKNVVGKIDGNYLHENIQQLGKLFFEKIKDYLIEEENQILTKLDEATGKKLAASGIKDVWKAAKEGKGMVLLVEKDYKLAGFVTKNDSTLYLRPPQAKHTIITDAVDDVMEIVMEKKGKVVIVENGKLDQYDGIAMLLRY